jgi:hypothetical protein
VSARPPWIWWLGVAAAALTLRAVVAPLDLIPDECVYIQHAWNLARGDLTLVDTSWYIHRLPVYLPTGLLYAIAGLNLATTLVWPILASMAQLMLAMLLALRLAGRAASVLAGMLLAVLPLDVIFSVHLMPDVILGAAMSASAVCWWLADDASTDRRRSLLLAAAGLLLGLATLVRPYALLLGLYFVADLRLGRRPLRTLAPVALGLGAIVAPYLIAYQIATGHALYRLQVVADTYGDGGLAEPAHLLFYPRMLLEPRETFGLHAIALLVGLPLLLRRPWRRELRLLTWLVFVGLFLEFGSMSLTTYLPILKRTRFLTPLSLPLCVLLGIILARGAALERGGVIGWVRRGMVAAVLTALVAASAVHLSRHIRTERPRYEAYASAAKIVLDRAELPVMVDHWRTAVRLGPDVGFFGGRGFYFGDDDDKHMQPGDFDSGGRLVYLSPTGSPAALPDGWVLIDRGDPQPGKDRIRRWLGLCDGCDKPDPPLTLVFEKAGLALYGVGDVSFAGR